MGTCPTRAVSSIGGSRRLEAARGRLPRRLKRPGELELPVAFQTPLGHRGLPSAPMYSAELSERTTRPVDRPISSCAAGASRQLSWSLGPPARARAEAGGAGDGEKRRVLRGLGSVGSVGSKGRQAGSTRQ
eukprot:scaffold14125_cov33-Phaeocystis_antarctica.AAC.1